MPKKRIVFTDNRWQQDIVFFMDAVRHQGYEVVNVYDEDPKQAFRTIKMLKPAGIIQDLCFEPKDFKIPAKDWWGCKIVSMLKKDKETTGIPIVVRTRHLDPAVKKAAISLGLPEECILSANTQSPLSIVATLEKYMGAAKKRGSKKKIW